MVMDKLGVDERIEKLRMQGLRLTPQRRLVLDILESTEEHLDAETVYLRALERDESVSLATVYRTLNVLLDSGVIQQRFLDHDRNRGYYELYDKEHFHFTCRACGRVIEFETELVALVRRQVSRQHGVQVQYTGLHLEGLCAECVENAAAIAHQADTAPTS
jgi:Fe2+ or Zn2+ uptake regulation protein